MRSFGRCIPLLFTALLLSCGEPAADIHEAAADGDLDTVRRLVEAQVELLGSTDGEARTPLHFAVWGGHRNVVEFLLNQGVDINATDRGGEAPLHVAVRAISPEMVSLLLRYDPNVDVTNGRDRTPLHLVARETGSAELATLLLDAGAEVNLLDRYGDPPLGLAAWRGFEEMVNVFLDRGAEIPADPAERGVLTTFGAQHGLERLFGRLAESGVDLTGTNDGGGTLLHSAAAGGSGEVVGILLSEGLEMGGLDRYGWTPLHYAAAEGHAEVVDVLLSRGADPAVRTLAGHSPLSLATESGRSIPASLAAAGGPGLDAPNFPSLVGPFFGQPSPGEEVTLFAADMVSSNRFEHGSVTFSPDGTEAFWSSSFIVDDSGYTRGRIMTSRLTEEGWSAPDFASFSTDYVGDDVPFFHPDGDRLFFLSGRTADPGEEGVGERIWYVDRTGSGWSDPVLIQGGPNELDKHWQFAVAGSGNIYFSSGAVGGLGSGDLYVSRYEGGMWMSPENLGAPVNTEHQEFSPFVAPDESYIILSLNGSPENLGTIDLWISYREEEGGWTSPVNLGPSVNSLSHDLCPNLTSDGRYLFFNSHRGGQSDVFWVEATILEGTLSN